MVSHFFAPVVLSKKTCKKKIAISIVDISIVRYLVYNNMDNFNEILKSLEKIEKDELSILYFKIKNVKQSRKEQKKDLAL